MCDCKGFTETMFTTPPWTQNIKVSKIPQKHKKAISTARVSVIQGITVDNEGLFPHALHMLTMR